MLVSGSLPEKAEPNDIELKNCFDSPAVRHDRLAPRSNNYTRGALGKHRYRKRATGGTQTMVMVCGETSIKHVTTFHTDSFETTATATTPKGVKVSLIKGRRIGECPAGGVK
jgi:hypothetical protein